MDSGNDLIIGGNEKFQYGLRRLGPSETSSQLPPVSFVNGVATYRGGTHVQMLSDAVLKALQSVLTGNLRREDLNHNFMFFANAVVNKPRFESQSKEMLTTKVGTYIISPLCAQVAAARLVETYLPFLRFPRVHVLYWFVLSLLPPTTDGTVVKVSEYR